MENIKIIICLNVMSFWKKCIDASEGPWWYKSPEIWRMARKSLDVRYSKQQEGLTYDDFAVFFLFASASATEGLDSASV